MRRTIIRILGAMLRKDSLTAEERSLLTTLALEKIGALPIRDTIVVSDGGSVTVNGRTLEHDEAQRLSLAARSALSNRALSLIFDQVAYSAITGGIHRFENPESIRFSKSSLWFCQQATAWLQSLAALGTEQEPK